MFSVPHRNASPTNPQIDSVISEKSATYLFLTVPFFRNTIDLQHYVVVFIYQYPVTHATPFQYLFKYAQR